MTSKLLTCSQLELIGSSIGVTDTA